MCLSFSHSFHISCLCNPWLFCPANYCMDNTAYQIIVTFSSSYLLFLGPILSRKKFPNKLKLCLYFRATYHVLRLHKQTLSLNAYKVQTNKSLKLNFLIKQGFLKCTVLFRKHRHLRMNCEWHGTSNKQYVTGLLDKPITATTIKLRHQIFKQEFERKKYRA